MSVRQKTHIPQFYIAKLGHAGVYLFFLFLLQNIDCGYSLEPLKHKANAVILCFVTIYDACNGISQKRSRALRKVLGATCNVPLGKQSIVAKELGK